MDDHPILALNLWQQIEQWDKWLFLKLNRDLTNPVFDVILPFFRDSVFWAPLYLFLLVFIVANYGRKGLWWGLFFLCTVALTDVIGARVFKESFHRLRPCQDAGMQQQVRLLLRNCSGSFSFVSNHAANHFGMATFVLITFRSYFKNWTYLVYLWALFISYAQVYVGVHYPLDILGGAGLGVLVALLTAWIFHKKIGDLHLDHQTS